LSIAFNTTAEFWLNQKKNYELWQARQKVDTSRIHHFFEPGHYTQSHAANHPLLLNSQMAPTDKTAGSQFSGNDPRKAELHRWCSPGIRLSLTYCYNGMVMVVIQCMVIRFGN
jgi:hypothetical protein